MHTYKINDLTVGHFDTTFIYGQIHLSNLFVREGYRRQGIGTKLMNKAFTFGRHHGCDFIFLETMSFQAPKFYEKLGFQISFIQEGFQNQSQMIHLKKYL